MEQPKQLYCSLGKMSRRYLPLLAGFLLVFSFAGCHSPQEGPVKAKAPHSDVIQLTDAQEQNLGIQVAAVHPVELLDQVGCNGQIQAAAFLTAQVFPPASGRVLQVPVMAGQFVRPGQLLATVKSDEAGQLQADLLQQVLQNEADYRQAKVQLEFSKAAFDRELELYKDEVSAKSDFESARAQYKKDLETLKSLQLKNTANIRSARERLSLYGVGANIVDEVLRTRQIYPFLSVTSPRAGLLVARNVNNGEMVDTNKELFSIADLSKVWLTGSVYEKDIAKVHVGQQVQVQLDSFPNRVFTGNVNFISSMLNPQTRTMDVQAEVTNPQLSLKPNMFARMSILLGKRNVLAVPLSAVEQIGDYSFVFVQISPKLFEPRRVTLGQQNEQFAEVVDGVKAGEQIAIQGTMGLKGIALKAASDTGD